MKNYKQILEAINRGIQMALDDLDGGNEQPIAPKKDVIKHKGLNAEMLVKGLLEKVENIFFNFDHRDDPITADELNELILIEQATNYRYKYDVGTNTELREIIDYIVGKEVGSCFHPGINNYADLNWLDVSHITDMEKLFYGKEFYGDISKWDVSKVENMSAMFSSSKFTSSIADWDTSSVTNMSNMFSACEFDSEIGDWNTSSVIDMSHMFYISPCTWEHLNWDVRRVRNMSYMFYTSYFNGDISNWNMGHTVKTNGMFENSKFNGDISKWDVSKIIESKNMFLGAEFNQDISNWDAKLMSSNTFEGCKIDKKNLPKRFQR